MWRFNPEQSSSAAPRAPPPSTSNSPHIFAIPAIPGPSSSSSFFAPAPNTTTTNTQFASTSLGNTTCSSPFSAFRGPPVPLPQNDLSSLFRTPVPAQVSANNFPHWATTPRNPPNTTPGTSSSSSCRSTTTSGGDITPNNNRGIVIEPLDRNTIVAVVEGRGQARGEIGIACMNMMTPTLILCQFNDTQSYRRVISKINIFRPYEILMPSTSCDTTNPSQLYVQLSREVHNIKVVPIQRRIFNEAKGLQKLNSLVSDEFVPVVHTLTNKYYCLAASHALLKYVELVQSTIFSSRSLRIDFQGCDQTCMIDHVTAQHLELLQNNQVAGSNHCLLGIVNCCKTPNGSRLLRMNILQPPCCEKVINQRLDCVEELMNQREILFGLQDILGRLPMDIEHVISFLIQIPKNDNVRITEQRINYVIALKQILELIPTLATLLAESGNNYFQAVKTDLMLPQFEAMLETIKGIIHDESQFQKGSMNMKRQRCFAVKADVNPILDIARKAYCDLIDDINNYVIELSRELSISFRLGTNNQRGFFVQFFITSRTEEIPQLPNYFLQVKKRGNVVTFTTEVLISMDHRAQEVLKEIENLSSIVITELITRIRNDIGILFKVSEAIGNLDMLYSLANYALTTPRSVRPEFSPDTTSVRMGRHPILDSISADPSTPNNTFLSAYANFMLITGPNMSGKTTYIKHVAALQVLAQLGSFVPADAATFRIASNIMSRMGTGDNIEENSSSFALEMTEMTYILQNANDTSLIIIDELGRATSIEEGAAISWAIAEELLKKKAFVLFATHHMLLTKLESVYLNALNFTMETEEWKDARIPTTNAQPPTLSKLKYTHVIKRGVTDVEYYGLKLAMNTCYPPKILMNAIEMSKKLMDERGINQTLTGPQESEEMTVKRNKWLLASHLALAANIFDLEEDDLNVEDVRHYLQSLQEEFRVATTVQQRQRQQAQERPPVHRSSPQSLATAGNTMVESPSDSNHSQRSRQSAPAISSSPAHSVRSNHSS